MKITQFSRCTYSSFSRTRSCCVCSLLNAAGLDLTPEALEPREAELVAPPRNCWSWYCCFICNCDNKVASTPITTKALVSDEACDHWMSLTHPSFTQSVLGTCRSRHASRTLCGRGVRVIASCCDPRACLRFLQWFVCQGRFVHLMALSLGASLPAVTFVPRFAHFSK